MDHQLDVPVYLSHWASRVHTTARGCVQGGTRTLERQKKKKHKTNNKKQMHESSSHVNPRTSTSHTYQQGQAEAPTAAPTYTHIRNISFTLHKIQVAGTTKFPLFPKHPSSSTPHTHSVTKTHMQSQRAALTVRSSV